MEDETGGLALLYHEMWDSVVYTYSEQHSGLDENGQEVKSTRRSFIQGKHRCIGCKLTDLAMKDLKYEMVYTLAAVYKVGRCPSCHKVLARRVLFS